MQRNEWDKDMDDAYCLFGVWMTPKKPVENCVTSQKHRVKWSKDEDDLLKKLYLKKKLDELVEVFGRTASALITRANKLGLTKNRYRCWNKKENDFLIKNRRNMTIRQIAEALGRSEKSVMAKVKAMGIRKSDVNE